MFNIGTGELIMIAVVALLVLGPKRLPELARGLGKFLREFRRQTDQVRNVVEREFYRMDDDDKPAPRPLPAPGAQAASVSPGGDDLHNPDGTLKAPPGVKPPEQAAAAPAVVGTPAPGTPAPGAPAPPAATPEAGAPAAPPAAEPGVNGSAAAAPAEGDDHAPMVEPVKSQLTAGLDHSDPGHPDYYKDDAPPKPTG